MSVPSWLGVGNTASTRSLLWVSNLCAQQLLTFPQMRQFRFTRYSFLQRSLICYCLFVFHSCIYYLLPSRGLQRRFRCFEFRAQLRHEQLSPRLPQPEPGAVFLPGRRVLCVRPRVRRPHRVAQGPGGTATATATTSTSTANSSSKASVATVQYLRFVRFLGIGTYMCGAFAYD